MLLGRIWACFSVLDSGGCTTLRDLFSRMYVASPMEGMMLLRCSEVKMSLLAVLLPSNGSLAEWLRRCV